MISGEFPAVTTLAYMAKHDKPVSHPVVLTLSNISDSMKFATLDHDIICINKRETCCLGSLHCYQISLFCSLICSKCIDASNTFQ